MIYVVQLRGLIQEELEYLQKRYQRLGQIHGKPCLKWATIRKLGVYHQKKRDFRELIPSMTFPV